MPKQKGDRFRTLDSVDESIEGLDRMFCYEQFKTHVTFADSHFKTINSSFCVDNDTIHFPYPCQNTSECTAYRLRLNPGAYNATLCGANGGVPSIVQTNERKRAGFPYAGGCSSGFFTVSKQTTF